jgi:hypothetical protein
MLKKSSWHLDNDPVQSARLLLQCAVAENGLSPGSYPLEAITIRPEPGWEIISFAIPGLVSKYGPIMREFAIDSACMS